MKNLKRNLSAIHQVTTPQVVMMNQVTKKKIPCVILSWYWRFFSWNICDVTVGAQELSRWQCDWNYLLWERTWDNVEFDEKVQCLGKESGKELGEKYNVRGKNLYFIWPPRAHIVVIDDLPVSKCLRSLPHPMIDRRGTVVIYHIKQFNKIPLIQIFFIQNFIFTFFHNFLRFSLIILFSRRHNYWDNGIITLERNLDANNINFLN